MQEQRCLRGARDENGASHATELVLDSNGQLLAYIEFGPYNRAALEKTYDLNGMVRSAKISADSVTSHIHWFANGQIASIWDETWRTPPNAELITLINSWDSTGNQHLKEGQGYWKSFNTTPQGKWFSEQGAVSRGLKQGKWIGKWADSTLYYEENYESGVLKNGFAIEDGRKVEYQAAKSNPVFKGGLREMYKFLGMNIKFPLRLCAPAFRDKSKYLSLSAKTVPFVITRWNKGLVWVLMTRQCVWLK